MLTPERMTELADAIASGKLPAKAVAPFLSGLINGAMQTLFIPMTKSTDFKEFDPSDLPMFCEVTLANGETIRVTVDKV